MEKIERTFIPQWLKGNGGGATSHQMVSPSLHSDNHMASKTSRNKSSACINDKGIGSSFALDRTTSSYFRRSSSSNGSSQSRSLGTFCRSYWDKAEKETTDTREQEKHFLGDHRSEYSEFRSLPSRFNKDLRRSQSMITGEQAEKIPRKMPSYPSNTSKNSGVQTGVSALSNVHKDSFERDFPSLGSDERQAYETRKVSAHGLSSVIPSISLGASAPTRGDTWTSALAEVSTLVARNKNGSVWLNMAETVAKGPSRAQTPSQLSGGTQRMEELAIKQSKQLIPVTPSMPKSLVFNSSEKQKAKHGLQQISSALSSNHSPCNAPITPDLLKLPSVGKLQILKPARDRNGIVPSSKDNLSPTSVSRLLTNTPLTVESALSKGPLEKKPTPQARSRNDFFDLMRKKDEESPVLGSSLGDESSKGSCNKFEEVFSERFMESPNDKVFKSDLDQMDGSCSNVILFSEEEKAAFLRSLRWEENGEEDEGLTEEEISSFFNVVDEPKLLESLNLRIGSIGDVSFGSYSSDSN